MPPSSDRCYCHDKADLETQCKTESKCTGCSQVVDLEKRIAETRALLVDLVEQRTQHYTVCNTHHDTLTRHLPAEICSDVFMFSLRDRLKVTPQLLGGICKQWRSITLATPQLWTTLDCRFPSNMDPVNFQSMLTTLLQRSGTLPLELKVGLTRYKLPTDAHHAILEIITATSHRWKELEISEILLPILHNCANTPLQRLTVHASFAQSSLPELGTSAELPKPQYFSLTEFTSVPFDRIPIRWDALVEFNGRNYDVRTSLRILRAAPLLKHFQMHNLRHEHSDDITGEAIFTHANLESLDLALQRPEERYLHHLFSKLTLPVLTKLALDGDGLVRPDAHSVLSHFLSRSECRILSLTARNCSSKESTSFKKLLYLLPSFETLEIRDGFTPAVTMFLAELTKMSNTAFTFTFSSAASPSPQSASSSLAEPTASNSDSDFLPNLQALRLTHTVGTNFLLIHEDKILGLFPPELLFPGMKYRPLGHLEIHHNRPLSQTTNRFMPVPVETEYMTDSIRRLRERGFFIKIVF